MISLSPFDGVCIINLDTFQEIEIIITRAEESDEIKIRIGLYV